MGDMLTFATLRTAVCPAPTTTGYTHGAKINIVPLHVWGNMQQSVTSACLNTLALINSSAPQSFKAIFTHFCERV
jgi:hypothetical protein